MKVVYVCLNEDGSSVALPLPPNREMFPEIVAVKRVEIEEGTFDA